MITYLQFWKFKEEKIEFRTFQIIELFAQKNEKQTNCVANQPGLIFLAEMSSTNMQQIAKGDLRWVNKILREFTISAKKVKSYTIDSENAE